MQVIPRFFSLMILIFYVSTMQLARGEGSDANGIEVPQKAVGNYLKWNDITVSSDVKHSGTEYFLKKDGGKWTVIKPQEEQIYDENIERLVFSLSNFVLYVNFEKECRAPMKRHVKMACACMKGIGGESRIKNSYNLCTSGFRSSIISGGSIITATLISSFTLFDGQVVVEMKMDENAVLEAAKEANLLDVINADVYSEYRRKFSEIIDSKQASEFIGNYRIYDPDKLIANANSLRDQLQIKEAKEISEFQEKLRISNEKISADNALRVAAIAKRQAEENQKRDVFIKEFRRNISVGFESNCGPVIEVKGNLIKIYSPIKNYGNEHWIRRDQIYPSGEGCHFFNGQYQGN